MNVEIYNHEVGDWARSTLRKTRNQVLRLCVSGRGPGYTAQQARPKNYNGEATKIVFSFPLYMVFVHKGAGRGYGGNKTGLFTRKDGSKGVTSKSAMGKMGTGKRVAKPWFNPVLEAEFPELAEIVADYRGEKVAIQIQRILID